MSRHEHDDISHLNLNNETNQTYIEFYGTNGRQLPKETKKKYVCAKKVINRDSKKISYFILCNNDGPYDPNNSDRNYIKRSNWKFRLVQANVFDIYKRYLETKYKGLLNQTKRNI